MIAILLATLAHAGSLDALKTHGLTSKWSKDMTQDLAACMGEEACEVEVLDDGRIQTKRTQAAALVWHDYKPTGELYMVTIGVPASRCSQLIESTRSQYGKETRLSVEQGVVSLIWDSPHGFVRVSRDDVCVAVAARRFE